MVLCYNQTKLSHWRYVKPIPIQPTQPSIGKVGYL